VSRSKEIRALHADVAGVFPEANWLRTPASLKFNPYGYPILLPQFSLRSGYLYFGEIKKKEVMPEEEVFLRRCDGTTQFTEILQSIPNVIRYAASAQYIVWWPRPVKRQHTLPQTENVDVVVIAAHPDDAELSLGGTLLNLRDRSHIILVTCFSRLSYTISNSAFPGVFLTSCVRRDEATLTAAMLDAEVSFLDIPEHIIRSTCGTSGKDGILEANIKAIARMLLRTTLDRLRPKKVYAPAAMGNQPDHRMLFDITLDFVDEDAFPDTTFYLYDDVPYSSKFQHVDDFLARFENSYIQVHPYYEDIANSIAFKQEIVRVFASQFNSSISAQVEQVATRTAALASIQSGSEIRLAERYWELGIGL
jgi:LmbE family N-acetylglucosaminyl deacetylase